MHPESIVEMSRMLKRAGDVRTVLEAGSLNVNGSYRQMIEAEGWLYTGIDIREGDNVDIVVDDPYIYPFDDGAFDCVISGSTMEHVERPWLWMPEVARVLRAGGLLAIVTHHTFPQHNYPRDYYRFMPDAIEDLFNLTGVLTDYEIRIANPTDITASAIKRKA